MSWWSRLWGRRRGLPTGEPIDELATRVARSVQERCAPLADVLRSATLEVRVKGKLVEEADGAVCIAPAREADRNAEWTFIVNALQEAEEE